ncbi:MAG: ribonuclease P protein component [Bacilli bacterium]
MKKLEIIKLSREYTEIINTNKCKRNKYFSVYYRKNNDKNKYGITVPKKTGTAVIRNKIKRRVKNIIDNNKNIVQKNYDYVIIVKKGIIDLTYQEMEKELLKLLSIGD